MVCAPNSKRDCLQFVVVVIGHRNRHSNNANRHAVDHASPSQPGLAPPDHEVVFPAAEASQHGKLRCTRAPSFRFFQRAALPLRAEENPAKRGPVPAADDDGPLRSVGLYGKRRGISGSSRSPACDLPASPTSSRRVQPLVQIFVFPARHLFLTHQLVVFPDAHGSPRACR